MVNAGSAVAHFVKLLVTAVCMRHLAEPYRAKVLPTTWCLSAFRILFMHSILGIFRFGEDSLCLQTRLPVASVAKKQLSCVY